MAISIYFGLPGSGKSTLAAIFAKMALRRGSPYKRVYCNFPYIGLNVYPIDNLDSLIKYDFNDSLFLYDEATLFWDNRNFKTFGEDKTKAVALHRHFVSDSDKYKTDLVFFCQQWDGIDKKLRELATNFYTVEKIGPFTMVRQIDRCYRISDDSSDIINGFKLAPLVSKGTVFYLRKPYYKYFDSFVCPKRDPIPDRFNTPY